MLDVLAFLAYNTTPMDRKRRADILKEQARKKYTDAQLDFLNYIMDLYVRNGYKELGTDKLPTLTKMKYGSTYDAIYRLQMKPDQIRDFFLSVQQQLYA